MSGGAGKAMVGGSQGQEPLILEFKLATAFPSRGLFGLNPISKGTELIGF